MQDLACDSAGGHTPLAVPPLLPGHSGSASATGTPPSLTPCCSRRSGGLRKEVDPRYLVYCLYQMNFELISPLLAFPYTKVLIKWQGVFICHIGAV